VTNNDNGLQFLPTREADEDQQRALYNLMNLVDSGYFRCSNCGESVLDGVYPDSAATIGHWLSTLQEGQRGYPPENPEANSGYLIVAPHRSADRKVQEAAVDVIRVARLAEKACPTCGEMMRLDYTEEEKHAVPVVNEWLGRQYASAA
jgi:hypothetical protein